MNKLFLILSLFFLSGCFDNDKKLLMKCADTEYDKQWKKAYGEGFMTLKELVGNSLEERFQFKNYVAIYRMCELELSVSPKTFRQIYKYSHKKNK